MKLTFVKSERDTPYPTGGLLRFKLKDSDNWIQGYSDEFSTDFIDGDWGKRIVNNVYKWQEVYCYEYAPYNQ